MPWCRAGRGLVARPSLCPRTRCVVRRSPAAHQDTHTYIQERVDPARVCAPMPTGVVTDIKNLEATGFGFIKPDNGEAASCRARAHSPALCSAALGVCGFCSAPESPPLRAAPVRARMPLRAIAPNPRAMT